MTYCVGVKLDAGLVMMSDTRTNAGLDNISRFKKMFTWEVPGERILIACCAGNLSITQGVLTRINADIARAKDDAEVETILNAPTLFRSAQLFGDAMKNVQERHRQTLQSQGAGADASILLGGQRRDGEMRLYLVYSAGNFIEATEDTPFFQIGEHKIGNALLTFGKGAIPCAKLGDDINNRGHEAVYTGLNAMTSISTFASTIRAD